MNYNISFSEMNKLAEQANSKKSKLTFCHGHIAAQGPVPETLRG
jgi:hypothetical protein